MSYNLNEPVDDSEIPPCDCGCGEYADECPRFDEPDFGELAELILDDQLIAWCDEQDARTTAESLSDLPGGLCG